MAGLQLYDSTASTLRGVSPTIVYFRKTLAERGMRLPAARLNPLIDFAARRTGKVIETGRLTPERQPKPNSDGDPNSACQLRHILYHH